MDCDFNSISAFQNEDLDEEELRKRCYKVATDIENRKLTLAKFVEDLRVFLINPLPSKREYGVTILSKILHNLRRDFLSVTELEYISEFYADRLKDHSQVIPPTLSGILAIFRYDNVSPYGINKLLSNLGYYVACQQQQQSTRRVIYTLYEEFLKLHGEMLPYLNHALLSSIMSSMDGERDPKNLQFLFSWLPDLFRKADLEKLAEDMFEILACYFPIDFRAPRRNPGAVSREELADGLCRCLTASPKFGKYCIPLALEKLDSSLHTAKLDSLNLIEHGCKIFRSSDVMNHVVELWTALKQELLNNKDLEIQERCWPALQSFLRNVLFSSSKTDHSNFFSTVNKSLEKHLHPRNPEFSVAWRIMSEIAVVSESACENVISEVVPLLLNIYKISEKSDEKVKVFPALSSLLLAFNTMKPDIDVNGVHELNLLPGFFIKEILNENDDVRRMAYVALSQIPHLISTEHRNLVYSTLPLALIEERSEKVRYKILDCLERFSIHYPEEIMAKIVEQINVEELTNPRRYFEALCYLIPQPELSERIADIFIAFLTHEKVEIVSDAAHCMKNYFLRNENNETVEKILMDKNVIHIIIVWTKEHCTILNCANNKSMLQDISYIVSRLMGSQSSRIQRRIYENEMEVIQECLCNRYVYVVLTASVHYSLRQNFKFHDSVIENLIQEDLLEKFMLDSLRQEISGIIVMLVANIINKCDNAKANHYLQLIEEKIDTIRNVPKAIAWLPYIVKALAQRNHPDVQKWLAKMLSILSEHEAIAKKFRIIMDDSCETLSTKCHCKVSFLYRQKFFTLAAHRLSDLYDSNRNPSYLEAFGNLWFHTPQQVILLNFKKLRKLTILCLEQGKDGDVVYAILDRLKVFIWEHEPIMVDHSEDFIEPILKLVKFEGSMKVRIAALKCLQNYTHGYPMYKLQPYVQNVLETLGQSIDDKKRMVRKEAALTRSYWYLIDSDEFR